MEHRWREQRRKVNSTRSDHTHPSWAWKLIRMSGERKEGDVLEISQPYPTSHPDPRVAGKTVVFTLTIKSVKEKKLPALDDEFAKDCGPYNSLQEIKDKLRDGMEQALKREIEDTYKDTIVKRLMDTHHFDLPETLVERELEAIVRQHVQQQQRKSGAQETPDTEDLTSLRQEHRDEAARRVKVSLVLEAIAEKEGLTVTQDDFNAEIVRLASEFENAGCRSRQDDQSWRARVHR